MVNHFIYRFLTIEHIKESPQNRSMSPEKQSRDSYGESEERLLESKLQRKKAEEDAKLLANRIALLRLEEQKALKKVEETRKKAKEILELKQRNAEAQRLKDEVFHIVIANA